MSGKYDDILNLPHHVSASRPHMPAADRAAQFAPFAALTGYGEAVAETARLTEEWVELDEDAIALLDGRLREIRDKLAEQPVVTVRYFVPDPRKSGGAYRTQTGRVRKIDGFKGILVLGEDCEIPIRRIVGIGD